MKTGPKPTNPELRFWMLVNITRSCWLWLGTDNGVGYGTFALTWKKRVYAHRYAYELMRGAFVQDSALRES
jgi:hypothetical protein